MDLLNNIYNTVYTALTTENEILINIMSIPILLFIEIPLIMYMFIYALNISATRKQKITYVISMASVSAFTTFIIPSPFNVIFNYIIMVVFILLIFKLNILKSFIAMIIPTVTATLISTLILNPFLEIFNLNYNQVAYIPVYKYLYLIIFYALLLCINLILKYKNITITILDEFDRKNKIILLSNLSLGLTSIILQIFLTFYFIDILPIIVTFISWITLLAYFIISIYSITRATKLVLTAQKLQSAEEYNKSLSILYDNVKGFKHDFDNIVSTIGGFVKTDDMEGLKQYYHQLEDDCQKVNNIATLNPDIINNPGIYNLLSSKYHKADDLNIKINLEYFVDLNEFNIKIYELSRILGILLDNAIEAANECTEKVINIKFRKEANKRRHIIIIANTYKNKDVDIENIFNKSISSKENHTGLGLWEVRKILNKNNNLNLFTSKDDKLFKQQLEIYY